MLEWINDRELRVFEIYSIAMLIFRKNFKKIAFVVGTVFFPIALLHTVIMNQLFLTAGSLATLVQSGLNLESSEVIDMAIAYGGNQILQIMVLLWLEPVGIIAVAKLTKTYLVSGEISPRDAIGEGLNCLSKYMLAGVFVALLVGLGFGMFFIPGVYLGVLISFYLYAIGLSGEKGKGSLRYSAGLVKGRWFKTLGFIIFTIFISMGFNTMIGYITALAGDGWLGDALYMTLSYFTQSLTIICTAILFLNREMLVYGKKLYAEPIEATVVDEIEL